MSVAIHVRNLTVAYHNLTALEDVSFDVHEGDQTAIIGPNGAGKSSLLKALLGLIPATRRDAVQVVGGSSRLGYVPQYDAVDWQFPVTVTDVVMMGLTRQIGWLRRPNAQHRAWVQEALARVKLEELATRQIGELSGGQRRRVFIARALAQRADILLLDEPFAGVDMAAQDNLMATIDELNVAGITILLSTHDLALAFGRFSKVLALHERMVGYGTPQQVYRPEVLAALYGGAAALWQEEGRTVLFADAAAHA